jgi:hypothetical protein
MSMADEGTSGLAACFGVVMISGVGLLGRASGSPSVGFRMDGNPCIKLDLPN